MLLLVHWLTSTVNKYASLCVYRFIRETVTVRDACTVMEKTLTPNITEMLKKKGDVCFVAPSQGYFDIFEFLGDRMFIAVWTFRVPAQQCFVLRFFLRTWSGPKTKYNDKLTILDGGLILPVVIKSGLFQYERPMQNNTTTVSVVYMYASLTRSVYWRMAPSLKTSDCKCWLSPRSFLFARLTDCIYWCVRLCAHT